MEWEGEVDCLCEMEEAPAGEYILYADHLKELGKFQSAIRGMELRIEAIKNILLNIKDRG